MEALFNVPAQSVLPNSVRSDKTQVHVNQVLLPVSYGPGATLGRVCALRFCLVFSEALRSCLESSSSSSSSLLCPPETGGTSAAEGVDSYRLRYRYRSRFLRYHTAWRTVQLVQFCGFQRQRGYR